MALWSLLQPAPSLQALFARYCAMMRRTDLLVDPRFATAHLRRKNHKELLELIRTWMLTFNQLRDLETQVRVSGLALGVLRTTEEFLGTSWSEYRKPVVEWMMELAGKSKFRGLHGYFPTQIWIFQLRSRDVVKTT